MTSRDLHDLLHDLVDDVARATVPGESARVRRLGNRRRHRRHGLSAAAAAVVVVLAGGAVLAQSPGPDTLVPPPVASGRSTPPDGSPTPSTGPPTASRTVGSAQLLRPVDVPTRGGPRLVTAPAGMGPVPDEISICVPNGLATLKATKVAGRDFRLPGQSETAVETLALQFADAAAAQRAGRVVRGWLDDCPATITAKGATLVRAGDTSVLVPVETPAGTSGQFAVVPSYRQLAGDGNGDAFFESVGLTVVDDRVMLTVEVVIGMDDNVSLQAGGDPVNGMPEHPQFGLVRAAASRLAQ